MFAKRGLLVEALVMLWSCSAALRRVLRRSPESSKANRLVVGFCGRTWQRRFGAFKTSRSSHSAPALSRLHSCYALAATDPVKLADMPFQIPHRPTFCCRHDEVYYRPPLCWEHEDNDFSKFPLFLLVHCLSNDAETTGRLSAGSPTTSTLQNSPSCDWSLDLVIKK